MVQRKRRRCLLAVAAALLVPSVTVAELTTHIDRAGRLVGAGWGDGYHACESSGIRLGADLPPRSYSQRGHASHPLDRVRAINRAATTFYDRFDAARGHQDSCCCDDYACDATGIFIDGSEVIQTPRAAPEPVPAPVPVPLSQSASAPPTATVNGTAAGPRAPAANLARPAPSPAASVAAPPAAVAAPRSPEVASTVARDLPLEMRNSIAASRIPDSMPVRSDDRAARVSRTPNEIAPIHPGFRTFSRTERLRQAALGENFKMPPLPSRVPSQAASRTATLEPSPINSASIASAKIPSAPPTGPSVSPQRPPAIERADKSSDGPRVESDVSRDERLRHAALGESYQMPSSASRVRSPAAPQAAVALEPSLIESTPLHGVRTNPLVLPRATLELAKRPPGPDSDVIRQPR